MSRHATPLFAVLFCTTTALVGCGGLEDDPAQMDDPTLEQAEEEADKADSIYGKMCGGIAGFPCPSGYTCKLDGSYPDAAGKCVKKAPTCATAKCPAGTHCEMKGINGGAIPVCIKNTTPTCANVKCAAGTHCEMKGINGGALPVCIKDPVSPCAAVLCAPNTTCEVQGGKPVCVPINTCANVKCAAGTHCEMKGTVPVCIKDTFCGGIAAFECPAGQKCLLDGTYPDAGGHCVPETFCNVPADCNNLIHIMCVGAWQCTANSCSYHCGI
jgi:hypothetical protein